MIDEVAGNSEFRSSEEVPGGSSWYIRTHSQIIFVFKRLTRAYQTPAEAPVPGTDPNKLSRWRLGYCTSRSGDWETTNW